MFIWTLVQKESVNACTQIDKTQVNLEYSHLNCSFTGVMKVGGVAHNSNWRDHQSQTTLFWAKVTVFPDLQKQHSWTLLIGNCTVTHSHQNNWWFFGIRALLNVCLVLSGNFFPVFCLPLHYSYGCRNSSARFQGRYLTDWINYGPDSLDWSVQKPVLKCMTSLLTGINS